MDQNKALQTLIGAIELAQSRGAFKLQEVEQILPAVRAFIQPQSNDESSEIDNEAIAEQPLTRGKK